jgi:hypothetical protein
MSFRPPQPPPARGPGHGPFGEKAFRAALAACVVMVGVGVLMLLLADGAIASVGASLLALSGLGLLTAGGGLLAERVLRRRPSPSAGRGRPSSPARHPGGPDGDGRRPR